MLSLLNSWIFFFFFRIWISYTHTCICYKRNAGNSELFVVHNDWKSYLSLSLSLYKPQWSVPLDPHWSTNKSSSTPFPLPPPTLNLTMCCRASFGLHYLNDLHTLCVRVRQKYSLFTAYIEVFHFFEFNRVQWRVIMGFRLITLMAFYKLSSAAY